MYERDYRNREIIDNTTPGYGGGSTAIGVVLGVVVVIGLLLFAFEDRSDTRVSLAPTGNSEQTLPAPIPPPSPPVPQSQPGPAPAPAQ